MSEILIINNQNLLEYGEGDYYKAVRVVNFQINKIIINQQEQGIFRVIIVLNMKVTVTEIKHYQLKNILTKLDPT